MNLLAIETSGHHGSVALLTADGQIAESSLQSAARRHAQTLVSDVQRLLQDHQLRPAEIDAVAVSIGPGSFTGLRVGVVFAKTFAWINSARLIAVDTLQAIAQQVVPDVALVTAIVDAQRGEVFAADYVWNAQSQTREAVSEIRIAGPEQLNLQATLCGPPLEKLQHKLASHFATAPADCWHPRAGTIAQLAVWKFNRGEFADPVTLEPVYVRRSYAEEKR